MRSDPERDLPNDPEALAHALRAPGTPAELGEEDRYRDLFREQFRAGVGVGDGLEADPEVTPLRSRAPRRAVAGAAAATVIALTTGGMAAAYTRSLPDPIQTFAHRVIGAPRPAPPTSSPVVPAPTHSGDAGSAVPSATASARPTATHSARHHRRHSASPSPRHHPTPSATPASTPSPLPSPLASPSATPTTPPETATPSPSPSPTGGTVTGLTILGSGHQADVGARLTFTGTVTTTGKLRPVVVLQQRFGKHWARAASGRASRTGQVVLGAPPLLRSTGFRFQVGNVRSASWRVAMHPLLTASVSVSSGTATIQVRAQGGLPGDRMLLVRPGGPVVAQSRLDVSGSTSFAMTPGQKRTRFQVFLPGTKRHTPTRVTVWVPKAKRPNG